VSTVIRTLAELGADVTLAPERYRATELAQAGVPLGELVLERVERVMPKATARAVVLDTTHAKDGLLDLASAARAALPSRSAKKRVMPGDLIISRLRPYLRQVALAQPALFARMRGGRAGPIVACSTEFYVLAPRVAGESLAYLLPFFLCVRTQEALAAGQEGGHHPRVPRDTLLGLRVPHSFLRRRAKTSAALERALTKLYEARARLDAVMGPT